MSNSLTDARVKVEYKAACAAAKASGRPARCAREAAMYLSVQPTGRATWYFRYPAPGRRTIDLALEIGYPSENSLKRARQKREDLKRQREDGADPRQQKRAKRQEGEDTLQACALEWLSTKGSLSRKTRTAIERRLRKYVFPKLGSKPIGTIVAKDIFELLGGIPSGDENKLAETARRIRIYLDGIWRLAILQEKAAFNAAAGLQKDLKKGITRGFAAITDPLKFGQLLRDIDAHPGQPVVRCALQLMAHTFLRSTELRGGTWSEIEDLEGRAPVWRVPGSRMKQRVQHLVPLSPQAVTILKELRLHAGDNPVLLFPGLRSRTRCISENTLNAALRAAGYDQHTHVAHGFRKSASTLLHERGHDTLLIELQLAHTDKDKVRAAYNLASRLDDRRRMMAAWSNMCDQMRSGSNVTSIKRNRDSVVAA